MKTFTAQFLGAAMLLPGLATAGTAVDLVDDSGNDEWQFRAGLYGYFPEISGTSRFPVGADIAIAADDLVRNTEVAIMGAMEARKGRWSGFLDTIYFDAGESINDTTALALGDMPLPPGVTADASIDVTATVATLAGSYSVVSGPRVRVDLFAGGRYLDIETEATVELSTDLGPILGPITGSAEGDSLNAIVGVKGQITLGQWFIPYYADVGTGDADITTQATLGLGYATSWGEIFATYRHLDFEIDTDARLADIGFSGPAIGVSYRW